MAKLFLTLLILIGICGGAYWYIAQNGDGLAAQNTEQDDSQVVATTTEQSMQDSAEAVIGQSSKNNDILAYHFGEGDKEVLFVGGMHGGYEWNTVLLAYELIDALKADPSLVPSGVKVTVIPVLNPDGLAAVVGTTSRFAAADVPSAASAQVAGRLNANSVDLNRNFDCDWKSQGTWQNKTVSGGSAAFSEPESQALKSYVESHALSAAVFWFSAAGGVYSSSCGESVSSATQALTQAFASASGYPAHQDFTSYAVTGDATNWLAKIGVPTISVLLTNHTDTEWQKNLAGIKAVLKQAAQ